MAHAKHCSNTHRTRATKALLKKLTLWLLLLCSGTVVRAQNNVYRINDDAFNIYTEGFRLRSSHGIIFGDSLIAFSRAIGDKKAECLGYVLKLEHAINQNGFNEELVSQRAKELREVARRNDYLQYYYFAYNVEGNYLTEHDNATKAIKMLRIMKEEAAADNYAYGLYTCHNMLGAIYKDRLIFKSARNEFLYAAHYIREYVKNQCPGPAYQNCAECELEMEEYDMALAHADTANYWLTLMGLSEMSIDNHKLKCHINFMKGDYQKFLDEYTDCLIFADKNKMMDQPHIQHIKVMYQVVKGDMEAARALNESVTPRTLRLRLFIEIAKAEKQHDVALMYMDSLMMMMTDKVCDMSNNDIAALSASLEHEQLMLHNKDLEIEKRHISMIAISSVSALVVLALVIYLILRNRVVTKMRTANAELKKAREEAETSEKVKTMFIQNMSHEIRTPMNAICGFSQLLANKEIADSLSPEERADMSDMISTNSELLTTLVNDILSMGDLDSGKYRITLASESVAEMCRKALKDVAHRVRADVPTIFEQDVPETLRLVTDKLRVQQILTNFLTNAIKHTEHGDIRLRCYMSDDETTVFFSVTDTGEGVPADKAETIFERFEKLSTFKQGTGLGLPICRLISGRLGGKVWLDTTHKGPGARFVFSLPTDPINVQGQADGNSRVG